MALLSIRLTEDQEAGIEELVKKGFYLNKNEAIRDAVRELLERKLYSIGLKEAAKGDIAWAKKFRKYQPP